MRCYQEWMSEYQASHQHPTNQLIHKICVPLITFSAIGLLWSIPAPQSWVNISLFLNWATIFVTCCLIFYLTLNFVMFLSMLFMTIAMVFMAYQLHSNNLLLSLSLTIFILAWIGQFYGHKIEGKKPSFFKDLIFLLIGPLWVLRTFYSRFGIKA